jgi:phenylalanyl-tRNA synthetase beta chain
MKVSFRWLAEFVPHARTPDEVGELLSRHCVTLDGISRVGADLSAFVVARVVTASRHPDSDHLWVTTVDDGSGTILDVVCGAPNVVAGQRYPFARTGTVMPSGLRIEKRKIRGATSNGMLCSARELGLGDEHDGILALDTDAAPGTPLVDVLPSGDAQLDLDVLPNRPDLLSHRGVAREIAAITGVPMLPVPTEVGPVGVHASMTNARRVTAGGLSIDVEEPELAPLYAVAIVRGVRVGESPAWLKNRLASIGQRSINNVVDATNYVLHGFGQPVHAFDLDKLRGGVLSVRRARAGETLRTLDGVDRATAAGEMCIADAEGPVAFAGVMGGENSEVDGATQNIALESAVFDARGVRRVRKTLGLSTDAAYRFERGVDRGATIECAMIAARLIQQVAGGALEALAVLGEPHARPAPVRVRVSRVARLLGDPVDRARIVHHLSALGCDVTADGDEDLHVVAPSWRHDLLLEVDFIEEVARLEGFDAFSDELRAFRPGTAGDHPLHLRAQAVRATLVADGWLEARPMPFTARGDDGALRVRNPLAEDEPFLRQSILDTLHTRVAYNFARMQRNIRLFEVGHVFAAAGAPLPREHMHVGIVLTGARRPAHFTEPAPPTLDEWDAKALAMRVLTAAPVR